MAEINKYMVSSSALITAFKEHNINNCKGPMADKCITSLNTFLSKFDGSSQYTPKLTPAEERQVWLTLVDGLSKASNCGLDINDHDLIYFIPRGKTLTVGMHYLAPFRIAKEEGYLIEPTFYEVFADEKFTLEDRRDNTGKSLVDFNLSRTHLDRRITTERLIKNEFQGFAIKLRVSTMVGGRDNFLFEKIAILTTEEVIERSMRGDSGIYRTSWVKNTDGKREKGIVKNKDGKPTINTTSIWCTDTKAMVYKTLVREIIRPLKEALPKLQKMYEFMNYEENVENTKEDNSADSLKNVSEKEVEEVEVVEVNIDLTKPTPEVTKKAEELIEIYGVNPTQEEEDLKKLSGEIDSIIKLSSETAEEKTMIKEFRQKMINRFASQIIALRENPDNKKVINEMFGLIANKVK